MRQCSTFCVPVVPAPKQVWTSAACAFQHDNTFADWWRRVQRWAGKEKQKGMNSLIIPGAWLLWKHRNDNVFNSAAPRVEVVLQEVSMEAQLWIMSERSQRSVARMPSSTRCLMFWPTVFLLVIFVAVLLLCSCPSCLCLPCL
uniref:Uncharacterized protein n=1 Tax=Arundo donax TaxID=35708 RepID=A0A0A9HCR7_ARUDO